MNKPYIVSIPPRGRTFQKTMEKLGKLGYVDPSAVGYLAGIIDEDKIRIKQEQKKGECSTRDNIIEKLRDYQSTDKRANSLNVCTNYAREGCPDRIEFASMNTEIEGMPIKLEGIDHNYAPAALIACYADVTISGFDEMAVYFSQLLKGRGRVKWPMFNTYMGEADPHGIDVRIYGSAGLSDHTGHFICSSANDFGFNYDYDRPFVTDIGTVIGDGKYQPLYLNFFDNVDFKEARHEKVEDDIKDASSENGHYGIVVVNTGNTVKDKGLYIFGPPLLTSETVISYNRDQLYDDPNIRKIMDAIEPMFASNPRREEDCKVWYNQLSSNLIGNRLWTNHPYSNELYGFC